MTTKIIVIIGVSVATVVGMYFLGKCADRGNAEAKPDTPSQPDQV
jgi:hypothetical protein